MGKRKKDCENLRAAQGELMTRRDPTMVETRLSDLSGKGPQEEDMLGSDVTGSEDDAGGDQETIQCLPKPKRIGQWAKDKRRKGFKNGGPRTGLAYQMERVKVVTPEVEEARQTYPLTIVAKRLGYKRASLKVILCKSGLPYLVVKGGPGPGSTYLPRSTVDALVARLIRRVGRWTP